MSEALRGIYARIEYALNKADITNFVDLIWGDEWVELIGRTEGLKDRRAILFERDGFTYGEFLAALMHAAPNDADYDDTFLVDTDLIVEEARREGGFDAILKRMIQPMIDRLAGGPS